MVLDFDVKYNVDPLLYQLANSIVTSTEQTQTQKMINDSKYFNQISSCDFRSEDKTVVDMLAKNDILNVDLTSLPIIRESVSNKLNGSASQEYASISIQRDAMDKIAASKFLETIVADAGMPVLGIEQSHDKMDVYMRNILLGIGKTIYKNAFEKCRNANPLITNSTLSWDESRYHLFYLPETKLISLIDNTRDVANETLCTIVKAKAKTILSITSSERKKFIPTNFLNDLCIDNFKGPLYCLLKTEMINKMNISKISVATNSNTILYFKQLAVDFYIKTCYPVIIYDYINCMMNIYIEHGDFINARLALFAKVMFAYLTFSEVINIYKVSSSTTYNNTISTMITSFETYLSNINNIDMTKKDTNMIRTITKDLRAKSTLAVDKNVEIQTYHAEIRKNQRALRNVMANIETIRKKYTGKKIVNVILICLLITVIVSCAILLFLDMKTISIYVAGLTALGVLLYGLINLIKKS